MWIAIQLIVGVLLLYVGAETLVRGGASLALRVGLSPLVVGLTVISFGTSSPELVVSFQAAMAHDSAIALGNVIGSNIANIALVLGLAALVRPVHVQQQVVRREIPVMLIATLLLTAMLWNGRLARWEGAILVCALCAYIVLSVRLSRRAQADADDADVGPGRLSAPLSGGMVVLGLALLIPGAHVFVAGAVSVAEWLGLSAFVIGLTVVAIGTSLPEIATSVVASVKGHGDMAIGNAVGSNIFNILFILGLAALVFGVDSTGLSTVDMGMMWAVALVSLPIMHSGFVITRLEGGALVLGYAGYLAYLVSG